VPHRDVPTPSGDAKNAVPRAQDTVQGRTNVARDRKSKATAQERPAKDMTSKAATPLYIVGLVLLATSILAAAQPADNEAQLQKLRTRIQTLQQQLNETRGKRDAVREEVQALERQIGALLHNLRRLNARLKADNRKLERLRQRAARERRKLHVQFEGLENQARAAYILGRQEYVKMLLNQKDPANLARVLTYYQYMNRARAERIHSIKTALTQLQTLENQIQKRGRELIRLRESQTQKKRELETSRTRRGELLAHLNQQVRDQSQEIKRLRADEQRLERLLGELKSYLTDIPPLPGKEVHFGKYKGKLPLPTQGRITARFGQKKRLGDLKWRGIFIAGREGQNVISVFRGRVAYADWLRGFGLLLILDHGNGYMTLYGHNQSLYKEVGDWVEAGQTIASVGNTGDAPQSGVYFEIRHKGRPRDPLRWFDVQGRTSAAKR